jgi:hypothetical protein
MRTAFVAVASLLALACGGAQSAPASSEAALAPIPYTAAEIAAGNPTGRWRTYRRQEGEGAPVLVRTTFTNSTADATTFEQVPVDESGAPQGEPSTSSATWEELRQHAAFPAGSTTIEDEEIEVPAGRYPTRRYVVTELAPEGARTSRFWFATDLAIAGPPVRMEIEVGGAVVSRMELVAIGP